MMTRAKRAELLRQIEACGDENITETLDTLRRVVREMLEDVPVESEHAAAVDREIEGMRHGRGDREPRK